MIRDIIVGAGGCMRSYGIRPGDVLVVDTEAPIVSGDIVRVRAPQSWMVKQLVSDGRRWFLLCSDGLSLISHYAFTPVAELQRVIGRRDEREHFGLIGSLPEGLQAGPEAIALYVAMIGKVEGFVDGIPWPGVASAVQTVEPDTEDGQRITLRRNRVRRALDLAKPGASVLEMNRVAVQVLGDEARGQLPPVVPRFQLPDLGRKDVAPRLEPAHAQEPTTNPTRPGMPQSLTIDQTTVGGTLLFTIGEPAVIPRGTRYQIWRSAVSTGPPASGALVYDGADLKAAIHAPSSLHYYFARSYASAESYFSAFYPGSVGISAMTVLRVNTFVDVASTSFVNRGVRCVATYQPDADGFLQVVGTARGRASFDEDSGTRSAIVCAPWSYIRDLGLGVLQTQSLQASNFGSYVGFFLTASDFVNGTSQMVFPVDSGQVYTMGWYAEYSVGGVSMRNLRVGYEFLRR